MIWYDIIWYYIIWYDMIWYNMITVSIHELSVRSIIWSSSGFNRMSITLFVPVFWEILSMTTGAIAFTAPF